MRSDFAYLGPGAMALIDQYAMIEEDIELFSGKVAEEGLTSLTMAEILMPHPLIGMRNRLYLLQQQIIAKLFVMAKASSAPAEADQFDNWLEELERVNKPYRSRNRGDA